MKRNLGRIVFFLYFLPLSVFGAYQWKVLESPSALYVGQSGVIKYQCEFDGSAADYTISFHPVGNADYKASILTQDDKIINGKRVQTFEVLINPLNPGAVAVKLNALVRHTTFASIENATIGRDNVKKYDFNDDNVAMPPVMIQAKESSASLNGDIKLRMEVDKKSVRTHEPVHVTLWISGKGNLDQFTPIELSVQGVNIFAEEPIKSIAMTSEGYEGEIRQEFALVAQKSYTIPSIELQVFDTSKQKTLLLKTAPVFIEVTQGYDPRSLLDPPEYSDHTALKRYAIYLFWFLLGIGSAEGVRRAWKYLPRKRKRFFYEDAKDLQELMILLALHDAVRYEEVIKNLESKEITLREAKKRLLKIDRVN